MSDTYGDAMPVIEEAIARARHNPEAPQPNTVDYNSWLAWNITTALQAKGWRLLPPERRRP